MQKLLLFSTILSLFVVPILAARDARPRRGLRKVVTFLFAFNVFYWFAIRYLYPHL